MKTRALVYFLCASPVPAAAIAVQGSGWQGRENLFPPWLWLSDLSVSSQDFPPCVSFGVKVKAHPLSLCSGRDGEGGLCWESGCRVAHGFWLITDTSCSLGCHSHHHSLGSAPKAVTRLELATASFSTIGGC